MATKKARRQFTKEFKVEAAKMVVEQGMKQSHVARNLGISDTLLGRWVAEYRSDSASALPGKGNLKPDDERTKQLEQQLRRVTMERNILKNGYSVLRGSTEVKYVFIVENRGNFPVSLMCEVLAISKSGLDSWSNSDHETKAHKRQDLIDQITEIHQSSRRNDRSPRILREIRALEIPCGKGKQERLMKAEGNRAKTKKNSESPPTQSMVFQWQKIF
ncbi:MAG: hypothetical protein EOO45_00145 [Flavobacterium sp.]|nr:MAG: hypothetical protein EOO45_00145 [Flavobacterium sp.]